MSKFNFDLNPYNLIDTVKKVKQERNAQAEEKFHIVLNEITNLILNRAENGYETLNFSIENVYSILYGLEKKVNESLNHFIEKNGEDKAKEVKIVFAKLKVFFSQQTLFEISKDCNYFILYWDEDRVLRKQEEKELPENIQKNIYDKNRYLNILNIILIDKITGQKYIRAVTDTIEESFILKFKKEYYKGFQHEKRTHFPNHYIDTRNKKRSCASANEISQKRYKHYYNKDQYRKYKIFKPLKEK